MRKEIKSILRREEIEKSFLKAKKELNEIRDKCEHEIVVYLEYDERGDGYDAMRYYECLFCGDFSNFGFGKRIINIADADVFDTNEKKFEIVKKLFILTAKEHPHAKLDLIVKIVQKKINNMDEDFTKIAKELCVPFQRKQKK